MVERANSKQQMLIDQLRDMFKTAQKASVSMSSQQVGFNTHRKSQDAATFRSKKPSLAKHPMAGSGALAKGFALNKIPASTKATKKSISRTGVTALNNSNIVNKSESIHQLNNFSKSKVYQTDVK